MLWSGESEPDYDDNHDDHNIDDPIHVSSWTDCQDSKSHQKRSDIFHEIIQNHCLDELKNIVEGGWDVNEELTGHVPQAPLLYAIIHSKKCDEHLKIVQLLLEHGANPNVEHKVNIAKYGEAIWAQRTALQEVARLGWIEVVKILLDAGAKCTTSEGLQNPLALSLQRYSCPPIIMELLLKHGANPNDHDDQIENIPLLRAIKFCGSDGDSDHYDNTMKNVKLLLEHGANPNVTHILDHREDQWRQRTALYEAVRRGLTQLVKMLLDAGAKFDTAAREDAVRQGRPELVKMLVDAGATSGTLLNPLALALQNFCCLPALIEQLLKDGADPNDHNDQLENISLLVAIKNRRDSPNDTKIVQLLLEHGANPNVAHTVNIAGQGEVKWTALHEAASQGWTEGVKMLLDAGAKCTTSNGLQHPLVLAIQSHGCPPDLIMLLLKHYHEKDDGVLLLCAITNIRKNLHLSNIVKLLLENGTNPNVARNVNIARDGGVQWVQRTAIHEAASQGWTEGVKMLLDAGAKYVTSDESENPLELALRNDDCPPDLIQLLLELGADFHYGETADQYEPWPLLQALTAYTYGEHYMFLPKQLDLVFLYGGNINFKNGLQQTALERAVDENGHSNSLRWLIRHGANTPLTWTLLTYLFTPLDACFPETPLILLQTGMRVSYGVQTQLSNIEVALSTLLQDDPEDDIGGTIEDMWEQLEKADQEEPQRMQGNVKKCTFPEYFTQQMVDLQEFSDESLQNYPQDTDISFGERYQNMLDQIHRVQEFLSQPQSLQWYCRRCVRENLVSLQPSVVRTLPTPAILKRYILCHEI